MKLSNLRIRTRLSLLVGFLSLLLIAIGALGLYGINRSNESARLIYEDSLQATAQVADIQRLLLRNRLILAESLLTPLPEVVEQTTSELVGNVVLITKLWQTFSARPAQDAQEAKLISEFTTHSKLFMQAGLRKTISALRANDMVLANRLLIDVVRPMYEPVGKGIDALVKYQLEVARRNYDASVANFEFIRQLFIGVIGFGLLFALLFSVTLVRGITRPLARAVQAADRLANGDLDEPVTVDSTDEIGQLQQSMATVQSVLAQFQSAQSDMAQQHQKGMIDHEMPSAQLAGAYGQMASSINALVSEHIAIKLRLVDLLDQYAQGHFDQQMQVLPGQRKRLTDSVSAARQKMVAAHDSAIFNVRILNALDKCSTNVMIADAHNVILFMNETAKALMLNCQPALQQSLSQFDASQLLGRDMVLFHPSLGKEAMTAVSCTWRSEIQLGSLHFGLVANPILDAAGARVGTVLEWTDRTTEVGIENQIAVVVQAAAQGKFDQRLHVSSQNGFFATLSTGMNQLLHTSEQGLTDVAHVLSAFAQGDLTQRIESAYAGLYGDVKKGLSI